jgi:hypothetical protein
MAAANPIYTPGAPPLHTANTASTVIHLAVDYLNACNEFDAGNGSQEEAAACLRDLQQYCGDALKASDAALDAEDWK